MEVLRQALEQAVLELEESPAAPARELEPPCTPATPSAIAMVLESPAAGAAGSDAPAPAPTSTGRVDSYVRDIAGDDDSNATPYSVSLAAPVEMEGTPFHTHKMESAVDDDYMPAGDVPVRVDALERGCVRLRRDMKTVWSLERAFEARMSDKVRGWSGDIADMRDGVVDEIRAGQAAAVEGALASTKGRLDETSSRVDVCEGAARSLDRRVEELEERVADVDEVERRLDELERRAEAAERRADHFEALYEDAKEAQDERNATVENFLIELARKAKGDSRRIDEADARARPVHGALAKLSHRIAAAVMIDDAANKAARGDNEGAKELSASFATAETTIVEEETEAETGEAPAKAGNLLRRLSRVGSGGGETLAMSYGLKLDAASEESKRTADAPRRSTLRRSSLGPGRRATMRRSGRGAPPGLAVVRERAASRAREAAAAA